MQLEDPRKRYNKLQNEKCSTESIPMQPVHGSPYHVYPTSNYPAVKAFQGPNPSLHNVSASPLLSTKSQAQLEMSSIVRPASPQTPRMGNFARRQTIQETSFTNNIDTDAVVTKINNMFPTASETHIRLLLKKYYNREAVVISALQVEKHPVTMPGPFATPPAQRHLFHSNSSMYQMTPPARRLDPMISRNVSPAPGRPGSVASGLYGSPRFSPKPHSSPKMKLRYLKNIFPKADETLLLDILANADNNVQKASEKLIELGYTKRDMLAAPKLSNRTQDKRADHVDSRDETIIPLHPKVLSVEEKESIKKTLEARYKTIADRIVLMALESVNYSEDRASQILDIVLQEDKTKEKKLKALAGVASRADGVARDDTEAISESVNELRIADTAESAAIVASSTPPPSLCLTPQGHRETTTSTTEDSDVVTDRSLLASPSDVRSHEVKIVEYNYESVFIPVFDYPCTVTTSHDAIETPAQSSQCHKFPSFTSPSSSSSTSYTRSSLSSNTKYRPKIKSDPTKSTPKTIADEETPTKVEFESILKRIATKGPNSDLRNGPNEELLLADYVAWSGANPDISLGHKGLVQGANATLLSERAGNLAHGHNSDLCKGPQIGLAKGSIYSQINRAISTNVKCN